MGIKLHFITTFHPQIDRQMEYTIQKLENLLRAYVMNFKSSWEDHLHLVEFVYNNSYQSAIQMPPFEALYGRACRSPTLWVEVSERQLLCPQSIQRDAKLVKTI